MQRRETYANVRSGNPWFDLAAHKLAQAAYFADVLAGRDAHCWIFISSVCGCARRANYPIALAEQRRYLREFLGECDWWLDAMEAEGRVEVGETFRKEYKARLSAALEE